MQLSKRMVVRAGSLSLLLFLSLPAAAQNRDDICAPYPNVPVNVTPVFDEPVNDFSASLLDIQMLSRDPTHTIPRFEGVTLGLTHYYPVIEFKGPILKRQQSDGSYCARVQKIDARIGYKDIKVYIAKEFAEGSCDFKHIMEHEQKHVAVNRQVLQEYATLIHDKIAAYLKIYGMFIVPNPDYAEKILREKVSAILNEMTQKMVEENRRRQKQVDNPEEYARNNTACRGHISDVARKFMAGGGK